MEKYYKLSQEDYNILKSECEAYNQVLSDNFNNEMNLYNADNSLPIPKLENYKFKKLHIGIMFNNDYYIPYNKINKANLTDNIKTTWELVDSIKDDSELRIKKYIGDLDPLITDFSIVGLKKSTPLYERGKKNYSSYVDESGNKVVEKLYTDIRDPSTNILTAIKTDINWYTNGNEIGLSKLESIKKYSIFEAKLIESTRRNNQIYYLEAISKGTPIEVHINTIIQKYYTEINKYIQFGVVDDLNNALINETDPVLSHVLNNVYLPIVENPEHTINVLQSVQYQLGIITMKEIIQANSG